MDFFSYRDHTLMCEEVPVREIAKQAGTPVYIYSAKTATEHVARIQEAFAPIDPLICFSMKANSNHTLLTRLLAQGVGCDVVSGGELFRALKAGCSPDKIVFAGVSKTDGEIETALKTGILMFNVESIAELENIDKIAGELGTPGRVALRLNPDVDPETHRYITTGKLENKFGIDMKVAAAVLDDWHFKNVSFVGFHLHIGSQITQTKPYAESITKTLALIEHARNKNHPVEYLNVGGGFGINYFGNEARTMPEYAEVIVPLLKDQGLKILFEPGRFIVGNAGILVTEALYIKESGAKRFVMCDAGMTDLMRPSLYQAYHKIWPVTSPIEFDSIADPEQDPRLVLTDVVGPICESGDFFAQDRRIPLVSRGDLLSVFSAGAYGFTMSSTYNSHPRPAEVLVEGSEWNVVRNRETYEDLIRDEVI